MSAASETPAPDIERVSRWLVDNGDHAPRPLLPTIRREFGLSIADSVAAIRWANQLRRGAA
jgi:hypothetical protein